MPMEQTAMHNAPEPLHPVRRFFGLIRLDRKDIVYVYLYAIFSGLITLSLPLGIQAIIGLIAGGDISASLVVLVLIVTAGTVFTGLLKVMQLSVTETIQRRIFTRSAFDFAYRLPRLQMEALANVHPPELVNRFFDTITLQKGLPKIIIDFSSAVLQIFFGLLLISFYHPLFVFFALSLVLFLGLIIRLTGPAGLKTSLKESKYKYEVAYWLEEVARALNTFKLAGNDKQVIQKTDDLLCGYLESRKKHFRILKTQYISVVVFKSVITASLLFLGSYLVIRNQINIGQFVAAEIVILLVLASGEKLILILETIYDVLTALDKLGAVADIPLEQNSSLPTGQPVFDQGLEISVRDLYYRHPLTSKPILNGLSFDIASGEKVLIAGYNASGRVTLMRVLSGLYTGFEGAVNYNGFPLRNLDLFELRQYIGDYSAEEDIVKGTILENITLGRPEAEMEEVIAVTRQVGLAEYLDQLPEGYQTILLPAGKNLPKKMRVRLVLARTLVSNPLLLIAEAFFAGQEQSDRAMIADLFTSPEKPWTLVAISDDPYLASKCDRVFILEEGRIVASGPFESLRKNPHFKKVFKTVS